MKQKHITRLEAQLEHLVEGAFTSMFGKRIQARDIALHLARAMENEIRASSGDDRRIFAPDTYLIYVRCEVKHKLLEQEPELPAILSGHLVELASVLGYRLSKEPVVRFMLGDNLSPGQMAVRATHTQDISSSTVAMNRVDIPAATDNMPGESRAQIIIGDRHIVELDGEIINIGRDRENHVVIDDPYVSRHHIQLRRRDGIYLLFDANSQSGTFVNNVRIREHQLQMGDVVRIGRTRFVYMDQLPSAGDENEQTQTLDPYE